MRALLFSLPVLALGAATSAAALAFWAATLPRGAAEADVTGPDPLSARACAS
jgi:hypothetical protein